MFQGTTEVLCSPHPPELTRCGCRTTIRCYRPNTDGFLAPRRCCSRASGGVVSTHAARIFSSGFVLPRSKLAPLFLSPFLLKQDEYISSAFLAACYCAGGGECLCSVLKVPYFMFILK